MHSTVLNRKLIDVKFYDILLKFCIFRALSQASAIASTSRDPAVCDQMKGSLIKKQVRTTQRLENMLGLKKVKLDEENKEENKASCSTANLSRQATAIVEILNHKMILQHLNLAASLKAQKENIWSLGAEKIGIEAPYLQTDHTTWISFDEIVSRLELIYGFLHTGGFRFFSLNLVPSFIRGFQVLIFKLGSIVHTRGFSLQVLFFKLGSIMHARGFRFFSLNLVPSFIRGFQGLIFKLGSILHTRGFRV